ncbi:hypothetical protein B0T19DRAFT_397770 [Cercophora scortea]|uniref:Uncharacterized protein n=1 Tax=Cercophora scortea TaxID=314031 RepID=A0AAE0MHJ5_9PEZI|nr:hypothetical protein B0T19DRAFT_397770 [Cercophora scortea]
MASPLTSTPSSPTTASMEYKIKEEFINQCIQCWTAKKQPMTESEIITHYAAANFVTPKPPGAKPGSLLPNPSGGYVFVPYDRDPAGIPELLRRRILELECWACDSRNSELLKSVEKLIDEEVQEKCYLEFQEGSDVSSLDFRGKVELCAQYRLLSNHVYAGLDLISGGQFKFGACKVDSYGNITMAWHHLDWKCTLEDMVDKLEAFSRPSSFQPHRVIPGRLKEINSVIQHLEAASGAVDLKQELVQFQCQAETENNTDEHGNADWKFFMCNRETVNPGMESRSWKALDGLEGFYSLRREAKRSGMWLVLINPRQLRFYKMSQSIEKLLEYQHQHYVQHHSPADPDSEGLASPYFDHDDGWRSGTQNYMSFDG